jgi:hypothetical protein
MSTMSCNCIVCAQEFNPDDLHNVALSSINTTNFKICESCLNKSDPSYDYQEARMIVKSYLDFCEIRKSYSEAKSIIKSIKSQ